MGKGVVVLKRLNEKGCVFLEMIPAFIIFFAVISFTINFFIYSYSSTVLSLAAQEAGRGAVASFDKTIGKTEGENFIKRCIFFILWIINQHGRRKMFIWATLIVLFINAAWSCLYDIESANPR